RFQTSFFIPTFELCGTSTRRRILIFMPDAHFCNLAPILAAIPHSLQFDHLLRWFSCGGANAGGEPHPNLGRVRVGFSSAPLLRRLLPCTIGAAARCQFIPGFVSREKTLKFIDHQIKEGTNWIT